MAAERPLSPFVDQRLDPEIARLVEALSSNQAIVTLGSCAGHGKDRAYVDLAVDRLDGLKVFVAAANKVDRKIARQGLLEIALNFSDETVTSCNFERYPEWNMLSLKVEGADGPPSKGLLARVAAEFSKALRT